MGKTQDFTKQKNKEHKKQDTWRVFTRAMLQQWVFGKGALHFGIIGMGTATGNPFTHVQRNVIKQTFSHFYDTFCKKWPFQRSRH